MSTKNIARSALEGGRHNRNKYDRRESHGHERSRAREWLDQVRVDVESADASNPVPRNRVRKEFTDKLNPCYRWLASKCGRPWSEVRSELAEAFDTRNLASWHIVNQHMLGDVQGAGTARDGNAGNFFGFQRFFIDDAGILRDRGKHHYHNRFPVRDRYAGPTERQAWTWADGLMVIDRGTTQYWAVPARMQRRDDGTEFTVSWRQSRRLTADESATWASFSDRIRQTLTHV